MNLNDAVMKAMFLFLLIHSFSGLLGMSFKIPDINNIDLNNAFNGEKLPLVLAVYGDNASNQPSIIQTAALTIIVTSEAPGFQEVLAATSNHGRTTA